MARIGRRKLVKLAGAGAIAAKTGAIAAILAAGRAPAYAQGTALHWLRWNDFVPASDELLKKEIAPAAEKLGGRAEVPLAEYLTRLEQASVANSLDNLMTFPQLAKLIEKGKVATHGAYFGVATGDLSVLDRASGEFKPVGRN